MGGRQCPGRLLVRDPGAGDLPGTPAVGGTPLRPIAWLVVVPAAVVAMARLVGGGSAESVFRALVLGAAASAVIAALARPEGIAASIGLFGATGAAGAAVVARGTALPDGAVLAAFSVSLGAAFLGWGLATMGRSMRCPDPGAGVCAVIAVVTGLTSLRWVDPIAERLPPERRAAFRQAVLRADLSTAAAYEVAGFDRLRSPEIYEGTTIASLPLALPEVLPAAGAWAAVGVGLGALGCVVSACRIRRAKRASERAP